MQSVHMGPHKLPYYFVLFISKYLRPNKNITVKQEIFCKFPRIRKNFLALKCRSALIGIDLRPMAMPLKVDPYLT